MRKAVRIFASVIVALLFLSPGGDSFGQTTNEVWISAQSSESTVPPGPIYGDGSSNNPYYGDFDTIITPMTNTIVHLLPGVFLTKGNTGRYYDLWLRQGIQLIGSGIDVSIIRRDVSIYNDDSSEAVLKTPPGSGNVLVSNLTVDVQATNGTLFRDLGIDFPGNNCVVSGVKVINPAGNRSIGAESWGITVGSGATTGGLITGCTVTSIQGDDGEAINASGQTMVSNNTVIQAGPTGWNDYGVNYSTGTIFLNNYSFGGGAALYTDTGWETNLLVAGNDFENCNVGVFINKAPGNGFLLNGISVLNNTIKFVPNEASVGVGIFNNDHTGAEVDKNIVVAGNSISLYTPNTNPLVNGLTSVSLWTWVGTNLLNCGVVNNTQDRILWIQLGGADNQMAYNVDLSGAPLDVTDVTNGYVYKMSQVDDMVYVSSPQCTNVTLAGAYGLPRKEVTIFNNSPAMSIQVTPPATNNILPSGPVMLGTNQSVSLVSDGLSTWTVQNN